MAQTLPLSSSTPNNRQWLIVAAVLAIIVALLGLLYFWFLAGDYVVLTQGARPEQAAAIVDELKKENIPYELSGGGSTILVPTSKLDTARLDISSQDLPLKGTVGFEIFDQSDMGLTDFAQKVNYQRALQGELERTIMAMDGITYARVHLAIPEHSLFREAGSEPRAAVTITPAPGIVIDPDRIAGIQHLVAATVPDLALDQVAVLNERGQLLTPDFTDVGGSAESTSALEYNYTQRAIRAAAQAAPNVQLSVKVTTVPRQSSDESRSVGTVDSGRDHSIRVVLFNRSPLSDANEEAIRRAVTTELSLDPAAGDELQFSPAPEMAETAPIVGEAVSPANARPAVAAENSQFMADLERNWAVSLFVFGAIVAGLALIGYRRTVTRRRELLVGRIRSHLLAIEGQPVA